MDETNNNITLEKILYSFNDFSNAIQKSLNYIREDISNLKQEVKDLKVEMKELRKEFENEIGDANARKMLKSI